MPRNIIVAAEVDARRAKVFDMYSRLGMSQTEIARQLGITQGTVSQDLKKFRKHFRAKYGDTFDPLDTVHEELENLEWIKQRALREYQRMLPTAAQDGQPAQKRDSPPEVRARLKALETAKNAAIDRISLMQDLGLVDRNLGQIDVTGSAILKALRAVEDDAATLPVDDNISDAERAWNQPTPSRPS